MKFIPILLLTFFIHTKLDAQILTPAKWTFTSVKIDKNTYQIHLKVNLKPGWHVYSQSQPKSAIATPLKVTFERDDQVTLDGKILETGKLLKVYDKTIKAGAWQYANTLDLVQTVKLKKPGKANVTGTVSFQVCTDSQCLAVDDKDFAVVLN